MLGYMCAIALCLVSQENAKGSKASFHNNKKRYVLYNIYINVININENEILGYICAIAIGLYL